MKFHTLFRRSLAAIGLSGLGFLSSCVSLETAAPPVATFAQPTQSSYSRLCTGRELYVGKCTKCHSAEVVRKFPMSEWKEEIMPEMAKKAKLSPAEEDAVMAYVAAVSAAPVKVPGG
jgi:hypothetical protein